MMPPKFLLLLTWSALTSAQTYQLRTYAYVLHLLFH